MDLSEKLNLELSKELDALQDTTETKAGELSFADYQVLSSRTYPDIFQSQPMNLAHMAMGMTSEMSELMEAYEKYVDYASEKHEVNISEELADCSWYLSNWCTIRGYKFASLRLMPVSEQMKRPLMWHVCEISDLAKKLFAYGKPINADKEIELLAGAFYQIDFMFKSLPNIGMKRALFRNIAKLTVRYPKNFDKDMAQNRDLAAEYEALSKEANG